VGNRMIEISKKYGLYDKPITDTYEALDEAKQRIIELEAKNEQLIKWQKINRDQYKRAEKLKNKLTKAEDILKERDGGGHDADCKIFRMVAKCNCGHQEVLDYFKDKS